MPCSLGCCQVIVLNYPHMKVFESMNLYLHHMCYACMCSIMEKTCKVKVDKDTHIVEYDVEEYEKLICEVISAKEGRNVFKCIHCKAKFTSKQRLNYHCLKGCDGALDINGKPLELKLYPSMPSGGAAEVKDIMHKHNLPVRNAFNCIHCNKECAVEEQLDYHRSMCCPGVPDINGQPLQQKLVPSVSSVGAAEVRDISEKHNFHRVCELETSDQLASFGEDIRCGSPLQLLCKDESELPEALCETQMVYREHLESHEVSFLVMQDGLSFSPAFVYQEKLDKEDQVSSLQHIPYSSTPMRFLGTASGIIRPLFQPITGVMPLSTALFGMMFLL